LLKFSLIKKGSIMQKSENKDIAEKVLSSKAFYRSSVNHKLLEYLVSKNLHGEEPQEMSIARDVFDKGNNFNPSEDTTVRVSVHNLRKKLIEYYHEEGKNDPIILTVPKGHYQLFFEEAQPSESQSQKSKENNPRYRLAFFAASLFSVVLLIYIFSQSQLPSNFEKIDADNPIWSHYFSNNLNTSIVIGDFLEFHETDNILNRTRRIQDYLINTEDSLTAYIERFPQRQIEKWVIGELPHNSLFNIIDVYPVFLAFNKPFEIAFTSEIDINYINNRNIIYIGEFKNLRILNNLTSALPLEIKTMPWWDGQIAVNDDSSFTLETYHRWEKSRYVVDLGMIAKLPGQNGENYLICAGFGYNSQIKLLKLLSTREGLSILTQQFDNPKEFPTYFFSLFEIAGFDRASTRAEVKYFKILPEDYFNSNTI
jgi:hypothetical protein